MGGVRGAVPPGQAGATGPEAALPGFDLVAGGHRVVGADAASRAMPGRDRFDLVPTDQSSRLGGELRGRFAEDRS